MTIDDRHLSVQELSLGSSTRNREQASPLSKSASRARHLSECDFSRWLTLVSNHPTRMTSSPAGDLMANEHAYYGALTDEFLRTISDRIRFWESVGEPLAPGDSSKEQIATYVERMGDIAAFAAEDGFNDMTGWGRLLLVAGWLLLGAEVAHRVRFRFDEMSVDERIELIWAEEELTFILERETGHAVEFKPTAPV
jgi:hypothetical protein